MFRVLYKIYFAFYFGLTLVLFYPLFRLLLSKREWFPNAFIWMKRYAKLWLFFTGIKLKVKGTENVLFNQPFIICANHSSFVDIPCLYSFFNQYFVFTGKKEIERWPLFNIFYTSGMNILVDRNNKIKASLDFKKMIEVINNGFPLVIFPEGTISAKSPHLSEFKQGAVLLAIQKQIPILPITFTTNWKRLQRKSFFEGAASPGIAGMIIHQPIYTTNKTKSDAGLLNEELRQIINQPLQQLYN